MKFELGAFFLKTLEFEEERKYSETIVKFGSSKISVMSEKELQRCLS